MALKKGSAAAKAFMAKLRAAKGKNKRKVGAPTNRKINVIKKVSGSKDTDFEWTRIDNDINGNPRYVVGFLNLLTDKEKYQMGLTIAQKYELALKRAKKLGGKKFSNKQYGGGIVFQSYNIQDTEKRIKKSLISENISGAPKSKKVGYKSDRTNVLKVATRYMKNYKDKGYNRKDQITNANKDAIYMSGTGKTKKYSLGKVNYQTLLTQLGKESKLKAAVIRSIKSRAKDYGAGSDGIQSYINDVLRGGGQSGVIRELIYYTDTKAWFKKYNTEISMLLREMMSEMGVDSPTDLFGKNWDKSDPFANDTQNQNLLAWFSYEETCREIASRLGFDY